MKNIILKYTLKALCLALIGAIALNVYLAASMTHVYASVTVTFGSAPVEDHKVALADAIDVSQLHPLPLHKPQR